MKNKNIVILLSLAIVVVLGYIYYTTLEQGKIDKIAQCLTEKKVVMYGASWCSHCNEQKELFGSSFKYVTYYNCSDNPDSKNEECVDKKIAKYPTWIMDNDKRIEGVYFTETLSREFGCKI